MSTRVAPAAAGLTLTLALSTLATAQTMTGEPAVDSAAVARAAYTRSVAAARTDSLDRAQRELVRAASAWPTQPAYAWALAVIAAARRDTAVTLSALEQVAAAGAGHAVASDARFAYLGAHPRFMAVAETLRAQAVPAARSSIFRTVPDSTLWPEGVDCTSNSDTCWLTSIAHRNVFVVSRDGGVQPLLDNGGVMSGPVTAVRYDVRRDCLWVTTSAGIGPAPRTPARAELARVNLHTRRIEQRWGVPGNDTLHVLGDLAISSDGDLLISDSRTPALYLLPHDASALAVIVHPLFRSLQGVAFIPGSPYAVVADYSHGLLRVDLRTRAVRRFDDGSVGSSLGVDGIAWHNGAVIGVQNGLAPPRVVQFTLDLAFERIVDMRVLDRNTGVADEPTGGSIVGDAYVYLANSSWAKFDEAGVRVPGSRLAGPVLLQVPLLRRR